MDFDKESTPAANIPVNFRVSDSVFVTNEGIVRVDGPTFMG